jgi:uncharacterized membrane protein YesL
MTSRFPASLRIIGRSIVDWWDGWLDMVLVTIAWFLAQFTIILGPPATFGLYYVVYNMINGEAHGLRGMFEGARKFFLKSLLWGVINLVVLVTIAVNIQFYGSIAAGWGLYIQIVIVLMAVIWLATQFYALAYFMENEDRSLRVAMRNGVLTALASPLFTFVMLIFSALVAALSIGLIIPFFLGLPGLIPFLGFRAVDDRLVAFGKRTREKTPKELEAEESSKIEIPNLERLPDDDADAPAVEVSEGDGRV